MSPLGIQLQKKPKNRCVKTLGYISDLQEKGIEDPIAYFTDKIATENEKSKIKRKNSKVAKIGSTPLKRKFGYFPLKWEMQRLEVEPLLDLFQINRNFSFSIYKLLSGLVYARVVEPASKKKTVDEILPVLFGDYDFSYDQVLECLDFLGENYKKIIELFTSQTKQTYGLDTERSFFDCTNYYFEIDREDLFRRKGPSKEHRTDPIIGMGLLLDENCIPIGMRMYPGNESEKPVLRDLIKDLKRQHMIVGKTIQIADKGLNCGKNLFSAIDQGDGYIFGQSIKKLPKVEKEWILNNKNWTEVYDKNDRLKYKYIEFVDSFERVDDFNSKKPIKREVLEKRLVTFNPSLAEKQRAEIEKQINKATRLSAYENKKSAYGDSSKYVNFLSVDENGEPSNRKAKVELNYKKIEEDLSLCGYNLLISSEVSMDAKKIYENYHNLLRIEESFRALKTELNARPVFLKKTERIIGHFVVCYVTLLLERLFQFKRLDNEFGTQEVYRFIRNLEVVPQFNSQKYMNVSYKMPLLEYMVERFFLPLDNIFLTKDDMKKVLRD